MSNPESQAEPCPFCKSGVVEVQNEGSGDYSVMCLACLSCGPFATTKHEAIESWNRAALPPANEPPIGTPEGMRIYAKGYATGRKKGREDAALPPVAAVPAIDVNMVRHAALEEASSLCRSMYHLRGATIDHKYMADLCALRIAQLQSKRPEVAAVPVNIQRYELWADEWNGPYGQENDSGEWCKWEDVKHLQMAAVAAVPDGYVLVPIEPTQEMLTAGFSRNLELGSGKRNPARPTRQWSLLHLIHRGNDEI